MTDTIERYRVLSEFCAHHRIICYSPAGSNAYERVENLEHAIIHACTKSEIAMACDAAMVAIDKRKR